MPNNKTLGPIPETMLAAVLYGPHDLRLERKPVPTPGPSEVLIRITGNTLCGTDGRIYTGEKTAGVKPGVIPGHEFGGTIVAVGEGVTDYSIGEQTSVYPIVSCGTCYQCEAGRDNACENQALFGYKIDGGLAEYTLIPEQAVRRGNLIQTETELPSNALSLMEPVSACLHGFNLYGVNEGDTVVIFGAGPIGLIHVQLAKHAGASEIIVSNRSADRRERALELGATRTLNPEEEPIVDVVHEVTSGRGADVSVLCVGVPSLANEALQVTRVGGRVNYFAGFPKGATAQIDPNLIHYNEIVVTGGTGATLKEAQAAAELLEERVVDADSLVSDTFTLENLDEAFEMLLGRRGFKLMVDPTR